MNKEEPKKDIVRVKSWRRERFAGWGYDGAAGVLGCQGWRGFLLTMDVVFAWPDLTTRILGKRGRYLREERAGWQDDTCAFGRSGQICAR